MEDAGASSMHMFGCEHIHTATAVYFARSTLISLRSTTASSDLLTQHHMLPFIRQRVPHKRVNSSCRRAGSRQWLRVTSADGSTQHFCRNTQPRTSLCLRALVMRASCSHTAPVRAAESIRLDQGATSRVQMGKYGIAVLARRARPDDSRGWNLSTRVRANASCYTCARRAQLATTTISRTSVRFRHGQRP
eukprot:1093616-Pleurochrysis_carterae.AAC.4